MNHTAEAISFKPLAVADLVMLHEWLHRPHVAEWWDSPTTYVEVERDYLPSVTGESTTRAYIALLENEPIGFIQSYVVMGSGDGWWEQETDPGARGIDQFLANSEQLGRGLGSAMISAFVNRLFQDPAVTKVQTDLAILEARNDQEDLKGERIREFAAKISEFFAYIRGSEDGKRLMVKIRSNVSEDEIYDDFAKIYRKYKILNRKTVGDYFFKEMEDLVNKLCDDFEMLVRSSDV